MALTRSYSKHHFLPGMEVQLLPHQIIGVSWLVRQERESGLRGGILADEMGLWVFPLLKVRSTNPVPVERPCR